MLLNLLFFDCKITDILRNKISQNKTKISISLTCGTINKETGRYNSTKSIRDGNTKL